MHEVQEGVKDGFKPSGASAKVLLQRWQNLLGHASCVIQKDRGKDEDHP